MHEKTFVAKFYVICRALNKKLRAEELLKISKLPPSMAKREEEIKKKEALDELDATHAQPLTKHNVEFLPEKKRKLRKKARKTKSSVGLSKSHFKSYVFDSKREKDKASVKVRKILDDEHDYQSINKFKFPV